MFYLLWFKKWALQYFIKTIKCKNPILKFVQTYHVLIVINGIGAHVKNTVINKKNFLPHTSDNAPINGADKNDNKPCKNSFNYNSYNLLSSKYENSL